MHFLTILGLILAAATASPLSSSTDTSIETSVSSPTPTVSSGNFPIPDGVDPPAPTATGNGNSPDQDSVLADCSGRDMPDDFYHDIGLTIKAMADECEARKPIIKPRWAMWWGFGKAQVYYCNYGPSDVTCSKKIYDDSMSHVDRKCGSGGGGWALRLERGFQVRYSVGRDPNFDSDGKHIAECGF